MLAHFGMIPRIQFPWFQASGEQGSVVMTFAQKLWQFDAIWCKKSSNYGEKSDHIPSGNLT